MGRCERKGVHPFSPRRWHHRRRGFCFGGEGIPAERYKPRYNLSGAVVRFTLQALFHKVLGVIA